MTAMYLLTLGVVLFLSCNLHSRVFGVIGLHAIRVSPQWNCADFTATERIHRAIGRFKTVDNPNTKKFLKFLEECVKSGEGFRYKKNLNFNTQMKIVFNQKSN